MFILHFVNVSSTVKKSDTGIRSMQKDQRGAMSAIGRGLAERRKSGIGKGGIEKRKSQLATNHQEGNVKSISFIVQML